jgi:flavorubredoxin
MNTLTHEIADGIYRFSTCVPEAAPGGFTFNQFLILGDEPLLFHTGPRRMFPLVREAIGHVTAVARLRWIAFSSLRVRRVRRPQRAPRGRAPRRPGL